MHVFICWSGDLSRKVAEALDWLIRQTFGSDEAEPFLSRDIEKGSFWSTELRTKLAEAGAGIVCLTPENLANPWIHFEGGAIASRLASRQPPPAGPDRTPREADIPLYPLLYKLEPAQLTGPLAAHQATTTTESDIARLVISIARRMPQRTRSVEDYAKTVVSRREGSLRSCYEEFCSRITPDIPVEKIIRNFTSAFQRKTFDEPVNQCTSQGWRRRYDGAVATRAIVESHLPIIRAASTWYQTELAEILNQALDSYADTTASLLMPQSSFPLGAAGELSIDPGIQAACEERRLRVKALVGRIVDSTRNEPKRRDAIRYFGAETFSERKLIVHRLEERVRRHWYSRDATPHTNEHDEALAFDAPALTTCRGSSWELDRIFYYLNVEYHPESAVEAPECAIRDVEIEMERVAAKPGGGSLMPVGYALGAVRALLGRLTAPDRQRLAFVLDDVTNYVQPDLARRDPGGRLQHIIQAIRESLRDFPGKGAMPNQGSYQVSRTTDSPASRDRPVFVSYSREDTDRVGKVVDALTEEGLSVFWDANIGGGQRWRKVIPDAINKAAAVVVLWTKNSVNSEYVKEEAQLGKDLNILMPVMFEGNVTVPFGFGEKQYFDLCGWAGERSVGFNQIVTTLRAMVERRRRGPFYPTQPWSEHIFSSQEQAVKQLQSLSGTIRKVGEVLVEDRPVTKDINDTLDEIGKTYRVVRDAIQTFLSPAFESGAIDAKPYLRMEDGSLESAIKAGRGHCTRILTLYRRHRGLRDAVRLRVDAKKLQEIDEVFDVLSTADGDMFLTLDHIGSTITAESEGISTLLTAGRTEDARDRIRHDREMLQPLRRQLTSAINELQTAQQALGYAGGSGVEQRK